MLFSPVTWILLALLITVVVWKGLHRRLGRCTTQAPPARMQIPEPRPLVRPVWPSYNFLGAVIGCHETRPSCSDSCIEREIAVRTCAVRLHATKGGGEYLSKASKAWKIGKGRCVKHLKWWWWLLFVGSATKHALRQKFS
jgi:hypothetical protein